MKVKKFQVVLTTVLVITFLLIAWTIWYNRTHPCNCGDKPHGTAFRPAAAETTDEPAVA